MAEQRNNHNEIKRQFLGLLEQVGEPLNDTNGFILDIFFRTDKHYSAEEVQQLAEQEGYSIDLDTVTSILKMFVRYGIARTLRTDDDVTRYEHLHIDEHHDHLICTKCHKIIELSSRALESFQEQITLNKRFYPFYHRLQIYGICSDCLGKRKQLLPLTYASIGERVRIEEFDAGQAFAARLIEMGLQRGCEVKVLNNAGAYILQIGEKRMAIGRGMANKIMVAPLMDKRIPNN